MFLLNINCWDKLFQNSLVIQNSLLLLFETSFAFTIIREQGDKKTIIFYVILLCMFIVSWFFVFNLLNMSFNELNLVFLHCINLWLHQSIYILYFLFYISQIGKSYSSNRPQCTHWVIVTLVSPSTFGVICQYTYGVCTI